MKKQINLTTEAYLIRGAFYLLLLLAVCAIPFALGQRNTGGKNSSGKKVTIGAASSVAPATTTACWYDFTVGTDTFVPGVDDIVLNCDDCGRDVALPFPVTLYGQSFTTAHVGSNGHCTFGTFNDTFQITCPPPFGGGGTTKVLAPYWVDQTVFEPNGVFTTTTGSAPNRVFYIEWRSVYFGSPVALNYEIAFFENGTLGVQDIYNTINPASTGNDSQLVVGQKFDENCYTMFGCDTTGGGSPPVSSGQALMAIPAPPPVQTVTSTADAGGICPGATCTLRQAIATAASGDTINFAANVRGAINLTSGELLINKNLTINGPGANLLSVQRSAVGGTPTFRIFNISANNVIRISGLTIANGNSPSNGGGISITGGAYHRQLHHLGQHHWQQRRRYCQQSHAKCRQQHHLR